MIHTSAVASASSTVAIGKFAKYGEYLRAPNDGLLASFDSWLNEGFDLAQERFGAAWQTMFQIGIPHGFLWRAGEIGASAECFCGVVAPSVDSVGRQYPLAIGARVSHGLFARAPHAAPLAIGGLLDSAFGAISEARAGLLSRQELTDRLRALARPSDEAFLTAETQYREWCRTVPAAVGWGALFPVPDPERVARVAIEHLARARRDDRAGSAFARLPLGAEAAGATALWLDVLRRVWGSETVASALWAVYDGALLVAAGTPSPDLVGCLWMRGAAAASMLDLNDLALQEPLSAPVAGDHKTSMSEFLASAIP